MYNVVLRYIAVNSYILCVEVTQR